VGTNCALTLGRLWHCTSKSPYTQAADAPRAHALKSCTAACNPDMLFHRMRSIAAKLIVGMALMASLMYAGDNSVGVWKRNLEGTKYADANPNPITALIMTRIAVPGGLKIISKGHRKDGSVIDYTVTAIYDGKDYPVSGVGSVFDTIAVTRIDDDHFPSVTKKGKYHMDGMTVISNGGKTMTITNKGTDANGKETSFTVVWDKVK